ncbi:hypothetical protein [Myceligenerans indicum]|uniref:Secreted protein n=1 Tax=Myceligenerans indicum TaxID=2593663 RepID=A0ABS1LLE9_9MICO|nr:hypothetical protein [Myceligenerans indicum]MBL0887054.1 hypothetical protein [Myceligenerans indicum]
MDHIYLAALLGKDALMLRRAIAAAAAAAALILVPVAGAQAAVSPGTYAATYDDLNAKTGVHLQTGTPECTVAADLTVSCTGYELGGVGNTNADVDLSATYVADVLCNNPAGSKNRNNDVEAQQQILNATTSLSNLRAKNGRLDVPPVTVGPDTGTNPCPNKNWTAEYVNLELVAFVYTLTFKGESGAYITIAQP